MFSHYFTYIMLENLWERFSQLLQAKFLLRLLLLLLVVAVAMTTIEYESFKHFIECVCSIILSLLNEIQNLLLCVFVFLCEGINYAFKGMQFSHTTFSLFCVCSFCLMRVGKIFSFISFRLHACGNEDKRR
jgi:hypothetical protein